MAQTRQMAIVVLALVLAGCGADSYPPVEILYADSGRLDRSNEGRVRFSETVTIPLQNGQGYAWRVYVRTNREKLKIREEITVSAPTTWGGSSDLKVSADGRTATKVREIDSAAGLIAGAWRVTDGDPPGPVQIKVTIAELVAREFTFEFKRP